MVKINESLNRVFLLRFDTGREAIARFPTSLAGPPHFATASEVATIDFLRRRLAFPIPRVLAWSSRVDSTEVGAEFMLMEKASGSRLADAWLDISRHQRGKFARTLGQFERQLLQLDFTHYGSLYYKRDVPARLRAPTLLEGLPPDDELNSMFCIGPIAHRDFWEAERMTMDTDRGPWRTAEDYMTAVARREQEWISRFGTAHFLDDPNRVLPGQGTRDDHIEWLSTYTTLVPILVPPHREQKRPVMWHPDLHAGNIFVTHSKGKRKITPTIPLTISSIIDWQGTCVGPAFLQLKVPPMYRMDEISLGVRLPAPPKNMDTLSLREKEEAEDQHKRRILRKSYEVSAFPLPILNMKAREERVHLEDIAGVTWKYGLTPCRMAMFRVFERWEDIVPGTTCPVQYSEEEREDLEAHHAMWLRYQKLVGNLEGEFYLGDFGYVESDRDFEKIRAAVEQKKWEHVAQGKDAEAKTLLALLWPYRDTLGDSEVIPPLNLSSVGP
ncbi:kinase-like domain-containing protein [Melanogaster broomeanus]|nr:kinase-like domain-containing protein [Melanogaster broomeanus]